MKIERKLVRLAVICALLFMTGGFLSLWSVFRANDKWRDYVTRITEKRHLLGEIFVYSGYGNGIHEFKNLVLRRDLKYRDDAANGFDRAIERIDQYLSFPRLADSEREALVEFKRTLTLYRKNVDVAVKLIALGKTSEQIDRQVKIDDGPALRELTILFQQLAGERMKAIVALEKEQRQVVVVLSAFFGIAFFFGLYFARRTGLNLVSSITKLVRASERIASADWDVPVTVQSGDEFETLGRCMDRMQTDLRSLFGRLKQSNAELERFAFVASHDLQEPLKKIQLYGEFLESECKDRLDENGVLYLTKLQDASVRMSQLIHDVLEYSRLSGGENLFSVVDLNALVEEIRSDFEPVLRVGQAEIQSDPLPKVSGNRAQLKQLFANLVGNAIKFRKPGHPARVAIRARPSKDGTIEIRVEDEGIGFDMKFAEKITEPFTRLHPQTAYPGTGIGLAICQRVAMNHGTRLRFASEPGRGARISTEFKPAD